ncbi:uncharacterized protein LOC111392830 isoform X2 [Olea europaea var. sylvestris]|uniref:uncharacterized protein LOC111392830 isoform X2 n=1 Tax=Olea europaea var. sylvestris TaxID=158386 RepID=UPI000C1D65C0|nr:uncharacterized protein LOC111392830 isoform X2 [Olea europaea var. sylvestris]
MPQDRLRSVMYRSFVTCDDPKGVVECKTTIKSKTDSQKVESRIKNEGSRKNLNLSSSDHEKRKDKVSKGSTEELQNLSSFQIMEVSRGAHKLNEVVDLWSNGVSFDKQSKKIAQDLLKGALDLQESIAMLGKLQEASRCMAKLNKKRKEKVVEEKEVATGTEFTNSIRIGDCNQAMDFQKPRISADGSTRDCYEELREVIRESFTRQNLLPKSSSTRQRDHFEGRKSDLYMDFPSTSSSQSSQVFSHDFASSDSSPLKVQQEKPKQSNLIAKLMGLEEIPTEPLPSVSQKHVGKNEFFDQRRYLSDIDLPRVRKPQFASQKVVQDRRTLEEMIESMQFKGLLQKKSIDGEKRSDVSYSRKGCHDTGSPIVLIRPLHIPELHKNYYDHEEKAYKSNQMPRKWKEEFPLNAAEHLKGPLKPTELHRKMPAGKTPRQKHLKDEETKNCGDVSAKLDVRSKDVQEILSCTKLKIQKPVSSKLQNKESAFTKIDKAPKVSPDTQQPAEIKTLKSQGSSKTRVLGNTTTLKLGKPDKISTVSKNRGPRENATISDKFTRRTAPMNSNSQKKNFKNDKPDSKPSLAIVETMMPVDFAGKTEIDKTVMPSEQIPEEMANPSDKCSNTSSPLEVSMPIIEDVRSIDEGNCVPNNNVPENESCKTENYTRSLLLSNASFLCHVEELFDTRTCGPTSCPTTLLQGYELLDTDLLLDCANEMLERKRLQWMITTYPLSQTRSRCFSSLDRLVREICDGIEDLRSYSKLSSEINIADVIYSMLDRDLWCKRDLIGAWDVGWRTGYTSEGVDEVVADIEKLVLSEIVEDALADFLC